MIERFLYLLQRGNHRKDYQEISKIERKNDFNRRINEYHLGTQIISVCSIDNEKKIQLELIPEFKSEFDFRSYIGNDYFDNNEREMISSFNDYSFDHLSNKEEEVDMDYHWQIENQRLPAERSQRRFKKY
jgi:hypothetical protein